jgi:hypothetical protein
MQRQCGSEIATNQGTQREVMKSSANPKAKAWFEEFDVM